MILELWLLFICYYFSVHIWTLNKTLLLRTTSSNNWFPLEFFFSYFDLLFGPALVTDFQAVLLVHLYHSNLNSIIADSFICVWCYLFRILVFTPIFFKVVDSYNIFETQFNLFLHLILLLISSQHRIESRILSGFQKHHLLLQKKTSK